MLRTHKAVIAVSSLLVCSSSAPATDVTAALTFIGVAPCRLADTRGLGGFTGQAGTPALVANATRTFQLTGTVPGVPVQCGIPTFAKAVSVNFTVTGFSAAGDLRVFPAGGAVPATSIINFGLENIANATTVPLGPSGGGENGITIQDDQSSTHVIIDVNGYYVGPSRYENLFILNRDAADSQCTEWNNFRTGLAGTYSRITISGNLGGPFSCGNAPAVAAIVNAFATNTLFTVVCDGRTWGVGPCGTGPELVSNAAGTNVCMSCSADPSFRPCLGPGNSNWGGLGGANCGAPSQNMKVSLER